MKKYSIKNSYSLEINNQRLINDMDDKKALKNKKAKKSLALIDFRLGLITPDVIEREYNLHRESGKNVKIVSERKGKHYRYPLYNDDFIAAVAKEYMEEKGYSYTEQMKEMLLKKLYNDYRFVDFIVELKEREDINQHLPYRVSEYVKDYDADNSVGHYLLPSRYYDNRSFIIKLINEALDDYLNLRDLYTVYKSLYPYSFIPVDNYTKQGLEECKYDLLRKIEESDFAKVNNYDETVQVVEKKPKKVKVKQLSFL